MLFNFDLSTVYAKRASNNRPLLGPVVSKAFSLNGGKVENIKQAYELLTESKLNFSVGT